MAKTTGAGVVMTWQPPKNRPIKYLLLKGAETGKWSFPKGHIESFDKTTQDTAIREVIEETGLRAEIDYTLSTNSKRYGRNIYWTGVVRHYFTPKINISAREHTTYSWFTLTELLEADPSIVNKDIREWIAKNYSTSTHRQQIIPDGMELWIRARFAYADRFTAAVV